MFIPRSKKTDKLFNRRLLAYYGLLFTVYWAHLIFIGYYSLAWFDKAPDAIMFATFLSLPGTLAGLGFWKYLKASEKDDDIN